MHTVQDVFDRACAFLFENLGEDTDFRNNVLPLMNVLAAEALPYENSIRYSNGEAELKTAPVFRSENDEIPYSDDICAIALPYGLASFFYQDEADSYRAHDYRGRFINALQEAAKCKEEDITDVYGGGE